MRKAYSLLLLIAITSLTAWAQIPANYYDAAKGKKGAELKTAMFRIIHKHHEVGYDGLFDVYEDSDIRPDGKIWDMYSNVTKYTPSETIAATKKKAIATIANTACRRVGSTGKRRNAVTLST